MKMSALIIAGLLALVCMVMVAPVMANTQALTTITGNPTVVTSLSLTQSSISLSLSPPAGGSNDTTQMTAQTNSANGYTVTVVDNLDSNKDPVHTAGHMVKFSGGTYSNSVYLASNMTVASLYTAATDQQPSSITDHTVTLSGPGSTGDKLQETGSAGEVGGATGSTITFTQPVAYTDQVLSSGTYQIIVEFDIAANT